jgi:hypothetical protein
MTQAGQHGLLAQVPAFRRGVADYIRRYLVFVVFVQRRQLVQ